MKLIGVTQRLIETLEYTEQRDALSHDWLQFFKQVGLTFVILPNEPDLALDLAKKLRISGVILTGGNDLPLSSDGSLNQKLLSVRDETELALLQFCIKFKLPTIGVCRGAQLINLYFSGTLKRVDHTIHVNNLHSVKLFQNTIYSGDLNEQNVQVNSFHNFAIDRLPQHQLEVWGVSEDASIEAIKHKELPVWGIMWHPERIIDATGVNTFNNEKWFKEIFGI